MTESYEKWKRNGKMDEKTADVNEGKFRFSVFRPSVLLD